MYVEVVCLCTMQPCIHCYHCPRVTTVLSDPIQEVSLSWRGGTKLNNFAQPGGVLTLTEAAAPSKTVLQQKNVITRHKPIIAAAATLA